MIHHSSELLALLNGSKTFTDLSPNDQSRLSAYMADQMLASGAVDVTTSRDTLITFLQIGGAQLIFNFARYPDEIRNMPDAALAEILATAQLEDVVAPPQAPE